MIDNYEYIFDDFRKEFMNTINADLEYLQQQKEIENELKHGNGMKEIPVSDIMRDDIDDNSLLVSLQSIIRQDKCEIHHGKRVTIRWIYLKKKYVLIFKSLGDIQPELVYTIGECTIHDRIKNNKKCIVIQDDKQHSNLIFEDHDGWFTLLKSFIPLTESIQSNNQ